MVQELQAVPGEQGVLAEQVQEEPERWGRALAVLEARPEVEMELLELLVVQCSSIARIHAGPATGPGVHCRPLVTMLLPFPGPSVFSVDASEARGEATKKANFCGHKTFSKLQLHHVPHPGCAKGRGGLGKYVSMPGLTR